MKNTFLLITSIVIAGTLNPMSFSETSFLASYAIDRVKEITGLPLLKQTTPEAYGAIPNDGKDDSMAIQAAADSGSEVVFSSEATYELEKLLHINNPTVFDLNGSKIFSPNLTRMIAIKSEFSMRDGVIETSVDHPKEDLLGMVYSVNQNIDTIRLKDLHFEGNGKANVNALKFDCSKMSGAIIKNIHIDNVSVSNVGRMAGEAISHTNKDGLDSYIGNIYITDFRTNNTGTINKYGMAWSTSGNVKHTVINCIDVKNWDDIAIENAGGTYFSVTNAVITKPKDAACRFVAVFNNKGYRSNLNTLFDHCKFEGNAKMQLNGPTPEMPVVLRNSELQVAGRIETRNALIHDCSIQTSSPIQSLEGGVLQLENSTIVFKSGNGRIDAIRSKVLVENCDIKSLSNRQSLSAVQAEIVIANSRLSGGFLQADTDSNVALVGVRYSDPAQNNAFRGNGTYENEKGSFPK